MNKKKSEKTKKIEETEITNNNTLQILLIPGEKFNYNSKLIPSDAFGFYSNQFISKRCGMLNWNKDKSEPVDEQEDEVFRGIGKYYSPRLDDFVIGVITQKSFESYRVDIGTYTHAILPTTEFEGATKKTKPNLNLGDVIFARVSRLNKFDAPSLSCISEVSSKNWTSGESFFGVLNGGNLFDFPRKNVWKFYNENCFVIKRISDIIEFEFSLAMNGKLWIKTDSIENIIKIKDLMIKSLDLSEPELDKLIHNSFVKEMKIESNKD